MKPSDFAKLHPWGSPAGKAEVEFAARNIMAILARTGDQFQDISWEDYRQERINDGAADNWRLHNEKEYFEWAKPYIQSEEGAKEFWSINEQS